MRVLPVAVLAGCPFIWKPEGTPTHSGTSDVDTDTDSDTDTDTDSDTDSDTDADPHSAAPNSPPTIEVVRVEHFPDTTEFELSFEADDPDGDVVTVEVAPTVGAPRSATALTGGAWAASLRVEAGCGVRYDVVARDPDGAESTIGVFEVAVVPADENTPSLGPRDVPFAWCGLLTSAADDYVVDFELAAAATVDLVADHDDRGTFRMTLDPDGSTPQLAAPASPTRDTLTAQPLGAGTWEVAIDNTTAEDVDHLVVVTP